MCNSFQRSFTCIYVLVIVILFSYNTLAQSTNQYVAPVFAYAEPSISPGGGQVAFSSGGDIWTVPLSGGEARLLISNPAYESRPLYSPDGKWLAFQSNRTGNGDIYVVDLQTGDVKRLT